MFADHMPRETSYQRLAAAVATASPRGATVAADEGDATAASNLRAWHDFDWRFLLPDPHLGPVWLAPDCAGATAALRAMGLAVVDLPSAEAEVAFVDGARCDFRTIERTLPPGALVRIAVTGAVGLRGSKQERGWDIGTQLEVRGWQMLGRVWAIEGIDAALGYVDVDDRRAVAHWWRTLRPTGAGARLAVTVHLALARTGLWRLFRHEGFVFARTPV